MAATRPPTPNAPPPLAPGLLPNLRFDALSGFLVFLIAMPLCLGIAKASQYPPVAGIWTAVIGGVLATLISNSQLTIKGPAAGLIVVVASAVTELGEHALPALPEAEVASLRARGKTDDDIKTELTARQAAAGYPLALGAALTAGVLQILLGVCRAGTIGELVPLTPVHGMLAAIGITIMVKQLFPMLGMDGALATGTPMEIISNLPQALATINGTIAALGVTALALLIAFPYIKAAVPALKPVPAQVIVLAVAIPLALALAVKGPGLVSVPNILYSENPQAALGSAITFPKFDAIATGVGIQAVIMFCLIASIESMLSSQAIDMLDPWRRKTDQNRDLLATGVGNTVCAAVGALPMISEIVRSKANIDNGARTKYANLFHGLFLLAFVLLLPMVINSIPMAALGAMLVFVGFRLASPREFVHTYKIGAEQFLVFVTTIVVTLSTDLLIGVCSGIALKVVVHLINGAPLRSLWRPDVEVAHSEGDTVAVLKVRSAAIFANWLGLKGAITKHMSGRDGVVLDLSATRLVDHSTMEKLHQLELELAETGKKLTVTGLDRHTPMSAHPLAARRGHGAKVPQGADPVTAA
ncbi:SulP family inorganic anion transporter [Frigoriglobus tundricola]|uniref:Sulfate transporter n=1 Tax=Frigoriglobus tundricola TaxID=2774151 RepID=A0A6M5YLQ9_9BACT|nr:SulP family inorganic anion transporter [Frigoriglobus tundricola]QJW94855.1 Sulfate transporter [Frigoriglobus tundricola]